MLVRQKVSLKDYNTFGIEVTAANFAKVRTIQELKQLLPLAQVPVFVLGGGSNVLLVSDLPGMVIRNEIFGRKIVEVGPDSVLIEAGGGENWHALVLWTLEQGFGGLENLSLIPGSVGAAPVQNIGAYGLELQEVFERLEAVELATGAVRLFEAADCGFGYRNSIFKEELQGKYLISRVWLRLPQGQAPNISYGAIAETLDARGLPAPTPRQVSEAVIAIRQSKLPDPAEIGNAGSFFKNPEVSASKLKILQAEFPELPFYPLPGERYKIPAGWLIEQAGWKGKRVGETGAYARQALVLVNYGQASGREIWEHAQRITDSIGSLFGIALEPEVRVWPVQ